MEAADYARRMNWRVGQAVAILIGVLTGVEHSAAHGLAVCFALQLLVDIRDTLAKEPSK